MGGKPSQRSRARQAVTPALGIPGQLCLILSKRFYAAWLCLACGRVRPPVFAVIMGWGLCQLLDVAAVGVCGVDAFLARCRRGAGVHAEDDLLPVG